MPDASLRKLTVTLPSDLVSAGQSTTIELQILSDDQISGSKRAIQRSFRDANASDVGRIRRVEWRFGGIAGAIGKSLWSSSGVLGVDFCQNLETRWDDRLTSSIKENPLTLTGFDPPGMGSYFGARYFGSKYFGTGLSGTGGAAGDVSVFVEQPGGVGQLFAARGELSTQIDINDAPFSVVNSVIQDAVIRDADAWYGNGYLALGPSKAMQRIVSATPTGAVYENTVSTSPNASVFANAIKVGSDRAWIIDAAETTVNYNFAGYTLDAFENMASPFQVGDPKQPMNGIGPYGPLTLFGQSNGVFSFTDQGKPVPLSRGLINLRSTLNGKQFADPGFGWAYYTSITGLRAVNLQGDDNPIGVGERMRGFTGHNGIPSAIWAARGELWIVYGTTGDDMYGYRGVFGPETAITGQPLLFPWFYEADETSNAIYASSTPDVGTQNLTVFRGGGTNLKWMTIAANGRDDLAETVYSPDGGTAYLTTLDKDRNLLKTLRLVRLQTRNLNARGGSWTIDVGFDTEPDNSVGSTYTTIGTVATDGFKTSQPVLSGIPLDDISGRTIKPRLIQNPTTTYTNLITNPGAEGFTSTGWSKLGVGGSIGAALGGSGGAPAAKYQTYLFHGTAATGGIWQYNTSPTIEYSKTYFLTISVWVPSGLTISAAQIQFELVNTTGDTTSPIDTTKHDQWQDVTVGPFTTPATGALTGIVSVEGTTGSAGDSIWWDGAILTKTSVAVPYFDGGYSVIDGADTAATAWTGTANASTSTWNLAQVTPPELDGTFEIEYDERPEQIEEIRVVVKLDPGTPSDNQLYTQLRQLVGSSVNGPLKIQLPDDLPPAISAASGGGTKYAMLQSVTKRDDIKDGSIEGIELYLEVWPSAEVLN